MINDRSSDDATELNRRDVIKKMTAAGVGVIGAGSASGFVGQAQAADKCPYNANECTGSFNKRTYFDGAAVNDRRLTQSIALVYYGHDHLKGSDEYLHQFQLFCHASAREEDTSDSNGRWDRSYSKELNEIGFSIDTSAASIELHGDNPTAGPGVAKNNPVDPSDAIIKHGAELGTLIVSYYYPVTGLVLGGAQLGASIISGESGGSGRVGSSVSREWGRGEISDYAPVYADMCAYCNFNVLVPDDPGITRSVWIDSHSNDNKGRTHSTSHSFTMENPYPSQL